MSWWDNPPSQIEPSTWGKVKYRDPQGRIHEYQIRALDVLYLASMAQREDQDRVFPIWCHIQKFGAQLPRVRSMKRDIELYSAAINPTWAYADPPYTPERANQYPPTGPHEIPGQVNQRIWQNIMNSRGEFRSVNYSNAETRRRRINSIEQMRRAFTGDVRAWRNVANEYARKATYNICAACWGNPIPGFDEYGTGRRLNDRLPQGDWTDEIRRGAWGTFMAGIMPLYGEWSIFSGSEGCVFGRVQKAPLQAAPRGQEEG